MTIRKKDFLKPSPLELYLPGGKGPFPLVCLTPILGRLGFLVDLFMERRFARFFASHGLATAVIERPIFEFHPGRGLEQIQDYLDESVERSIKALDFLLRQEEIRPDAVVSFGISFGSVVNVLWAAKDARLKAHVFALTGGNIAEIIVTSRDPLMRAYYKDLVKGTGLKGLELKSALEKAIHSDPIESAGALSRERVLMLLGVFDHVIPFRYGLALRQALGNPETIFLPLGHYPALLATPFLKWRALAFFQKKLAGGLS